MHQSGFVNIVGKPNVGKSTLMNALLGQELSMVNPKAQTTRHRIKGIVNDDNYQIVFSDTPGIMKPAYKLHHKMLAAVESTFDEAAAPAVVLSCALLCDELHALLHDATAIKYLVSTTAPAALTMLT
jgi:small GTP-binding protein